MTIKLLKAYSLFCAGDILDVDFGVAELLIGRGIAEEYKGSGPSLNWNKRVGRPPRGTNGSK